MIRFDIQRTEELINGFDDAEYGKSVGLEKIVGKSIDLVIGGPPCQAYSIAGRIRDANGMKDDYRNYLFESYLKVVNHFKPKAFIFENVPGILSAKPNGKPIVSLIRKQFNEASYEIIDDFKNAVFDTVEFSVPQKRKRIIIFGVSKEVYGDKAKNIVDKFYYDELPKQKSKTIKTLKEAIADLPPLYPGEVSQINGRKTSHSYSNTNISNHISRYHNERDIKLFSMLAADIENGDNNYASVEALKELYTNHTGRTSNIHKYHVLRWDEPSTTIPAHLCKDGLRHIHPDPKQARTITVREAARIQTFPDDYEFIGSMTDQFKMIGNAVPPEFARRIAISVYNTVFK